jgi:hypothetical protein
MAARKKRSKKPSGATYEQREAEQLASLTFFLDRNLGKRLVADALRATGATVEVHDDHFDQDASDEQWLVDVGNRGWVVISQDEGIRRNELELRAYRAARVRGFIVTATGLTGRQLGELLVLHLRGMVRRTVKQPGPCLYTISKSGVIQKLF